MSISKYGIGKRIASILVRGKNGPHLRRQVVGSESSTSTNSEPEVSLAETVPAPVARIERHLPSPHDDFAHDYDSLRREFAAQDRSDLIALYAREELPLHAEMAARLKGIPQPESSEAQRELASAIDGCESRVDSLQQQRRSAGAEIPDFIHGQFDAESQGHLEAMWARAVYSDMNGHYARGDWRVGRQSPSLSPSERQDFIERVFARQDATTRLERESSPVPLRGDRRFGNNGTDLELQYALNSKYRHIVSDRLRKLGYRDTGVDELEREEVGRPTTHVPSPQAPQEHATRVTSVPVVAPASTTALCQDDCPCENECDDDCYCSDY